MKRLLSGMVVLGLIGSTSVRASDSDELWEVISKMLMPGLPFPLWASTDKICIEAGKEGDPAKVIPKYLKDQECSMDGVNISGNKSSWAMSCGGASAATGIGEMTLGDAAFKGKSIMRSMGTNFTMAYEGKRVGTCQAK
jgi:hypothetical protein